MGITPQRAPRLHHPHQMCDAMHSCNSTGTPRGSGLEAQRLTTCDNKQRTKRTRDILANCPSNALAKLYRVSTPRGPSGWPPPGPTAQPPLAPMWAPKPRCAPPAQSPLCGVRGKGAADPPSLSRIKFRLSPWKKGRPRNPKLKQSARQTIHNTMLHMYMVITRLFVACDFGAALPPPFGSPSSPHPKHICRGCVPLPFW